MPRLASYRAIIVRHPRSTSTKEFCETIATCASIARYEKYRFWASKKAFSSRRGLFFAVEGPRALPKFHTNRPPPPSPRGGGLLKIPVGCLPKEGRGSVFSMEGGGGECLFDENAFKGDTSPVQRVALYWSRDGGQLLVGGGRSRGIVKVLPQNTSMYRPCDPARLPERGVRASGPK